jgi:hypothetical protein
MTNQHSRAPTLIAAEGAMPCWLLGTRPQQDVDELVLQVPHNSFGDAAEVAREMVVACCDAC